VLAALESRLDPETPTGLDYYPLLRPGERFPTADPQLPHVLSPRPADDALFLQGLLEGIARVEAESYRRLAEFGASRAARIPHRRGRGPERGVAPDPRAAARRSRRAGRDGRGRGRRGVARPPRPAEPAVKETTLPELAERYDLFLVDQFGVLHDGVRPYPGAPEALRRLCADGRSVAVLSNSGKRAGPNEERLIRLGFDPDSFDLFLSSGEVARDRLAAGRSEPGAPRSCLVLSRDGDLSVIDGLGIVPVERAEEADLVLIAGSEAPRVTLADYAERLRPAAARGVPALCANPDTTMLTPDGLAFAPGRIARLYESLGGAVTFIGKPYPAIYRAALSRFPEARRVVGVGDSVEHDVAGAKGAGLATALVRGTGIHAGLDEEGLAAECERHGVWPDHVLARFAW
jgi:HAD superfamily hydrolase (TIGR01459 family)